MELTSWNIAQKSVAVLETIMRRDELSILRSSEKIKTIANIVADHNCINDPEKDQKNCSNEHNLNC